MDVARLRVDQNGSLIRPLAVLDAFERHAHGRASDAELRAAQDESIRAVIGKQEAIGLPVVSDGEFRRRNFQESFSHAVSGYDVPAQAATSTDWREPNRPLHRTEQNFDAAGPAITTRRPATERLKLRRNVVRDEYRFSATVAKRPVKVSLIGPDRIAQRFAWEKSQAVYKDIDEFVADVVAIQRRMIQELVDAGCRYVHIDAPGFTAYVDKVSLDRMRARGEDPDKNLERGIAAENAVIAGFEGVTFGLHICRGNPRGTDATGKIMPQWHREGHYDSIAERLFGGLKHHRLLLEYDSERAGDFTPLRFMPKDKIAVLGLVTTKSAELESKDALKRRIDDAARYLPLEQLALSPQCGFNSGGDRGLQLGEDEQWRKFERILETAREVWG
jgi:5-methyltetrahydropteroyltriglutamate--homocysteine methyltransferase